MVETLRNSQDSWQKPQNAPDHPRWTQAYREQTKDYFSTAQDFAAVLYTHWIEAQEQLSPGNIVIELEVLKIRERGPHQLPKASDHITLFDLWAASMWDPMGYRSSPTTNTELAHKTEQHERFESLLRDAYEAFQMPNNASSFDPQPPQTAFGSLSNNLP